MEEILYLDMLINYDEIFSDFEIVEEENLTNFDAEKFTPADPLLGNIIRYIFGRKNVSIKEIIKFFNIKYTRAQKIINSLVRAKLIYKSQARHYRLLE